MAAYVFGKPLTYNLYAFEDKTKISNLPAQTVTGYLFFDQPSRANAQSGSGALSSFSKAILASEDISLTIPAIADPNLGELITYRLYWVAVNFILTTGGATQTVIRAIKVERVSGQDALIGVTYAKILEIYPDVDQYLTSPEVNAMIGLAQAELIDDLALKGYDWNQIYRPDQLFNALLFNTLVYVYNSQIQREGDRFDASAKKAQARYNSIRDNLKLEYDSNNSGQAIEQVNPYGTIWITR